MSQMRSSFPGDFTQTSQDSFSYKCPNWACKPPQSCGFYFDVMKNNVAISKLLLDDKLYFLIGRHSKQCNFILDHASVSRFHSVVLYHKHLKRIFLIDLGSTHGTFIGSLRLEPHKPQVIPIDTTIYFGQSTRCYTLRERKSELYNLTNSLQNRDPSIHHETECELDDLTQYNTALNRQTLAAIESAIESQYSPFIRKVSAKRISFSSNPDDIINPEDVDPSVGRFRNMVQSSFIPTSKRIRLELTAEYCTNFSAALLKVDNEDASGLYSGIDPVFPNDTMDSRGNVFSAAPNVDEPSSLLYTLQSSTTSINPIQTETIIDKTSKKIYAKEAWPGKKPSVEKSHNFLL